MPAAAPRHALRAALVRRPHGVRGELRCEALGGDPERFVPGMRLRRENGGEELTVRTVRALPDGDVLLGLAEIDDRAAAERLRGAYLLVDVSQARRLGEDEWFVGDLVGLRARTPEGADLGVVEDVEAYAEQDVLVVRDAERVRRLPMVRAFVTAVDLDAGVVVVTPWEEEE